MEHTLATHQKIGKGLYIQKRAEQLEIVKGELFILRKNGKQKVKIITDPYMLQISCHHCDKWMHQICCNIKPGTVLSPLKFLCPECTSTKDFVILYIVTELCRRPQQCYDIKHI